MSDDNNNLKVVKSTTPPTMEELFMRELQKEKLFEKMSPKSIGVQMSNFLRAAIANWSGDEPLRLHDDLFTNMNIFVKMLDNTHHASVEQEIAV